MTITTTTTTLFLLITLMVLLNVAIEAQAALPQSRWLGKGKPKTREEREEWKKNYAEMSARKKRALKEAAPPPKRSGESVLQYYGRLHLDRVKSKSKNLKFLGDTAAFYDIYDYDYSRNAVYFPEEYADLGYEVKADEVCEMFVRVKASISQSYMSGKIYTEELLNTFVNPLGMKQFKPEEHMNKYNVNNMFFGWTPVLTQMKVGQYAAIHFPYETIPKYLKALPTPAKAKGITPATFVTVEMVPVKCRPMTAEEKVKESEKKAEAEEMERLLLFQNAAASNPVPPQENLDEDGDVIEDEVDLDANVAASTPSPPTPVKEFERAELSRQDQELEDEYNEL
eukprot:TRINITY_DN12625_c0_g1_i1.p1 TRINITY_DN12625_c0_g1~~TRINITY_DN12625_c0_g1_i1.p1  ORF type:complete len:377 (+),score=132.33 TRINITY_DN12625_c0_g1_i1:114-1133(+)